jgi:5S rRNA maturation endonuclease (ribonuclease M5)
MHLAELLSLFPTARKSGAGWSARCPAHHDGTPSLSISQAPDGKILLYCHAGCPTEAICSAINIPMAALFPAVETPPSRIVAEYDYVDANGGLLFQVVRFQPKDFRQRRRDSATLGGWTWSTKGVEKVLFQLPRIIRAVQRGLPVFLCEGEKDVLAMVERGFSATCNPGGAGKWQDSFSETLRGANVIIIADKDKAGREHAQAVAARLNGISQSVRMVEMPDINGKTVKDIADFFAAGGDVGHIQDLVDLAPVWSPALPTKGSVEQHEDIRGEIVSTLTNAKLGVSEQRTKIGNAVVQALNARGRFFYHAERRDFDSSMFFDNERKQLERIRSDSFLAWLSDWLRVNRADPVFKYIVAEVETVALSGQQSTGIVPEVFWASRPDAIYLSNGDGVMMRITAEQVETVDNGTDGVLFAAGSTLAPWKLTTPQDPFSTCSILTGANCVAKHGLDLVRLWLLSLPTNPASKPPLCLAGDIGSGKTRLAKGIAELFGLPFVANKVEDFGEDSFWASLDAGGVFILDNCDTRNKWLPDAVASATTDGCSQRRKLYTDAERVTLRAKSWLCLTTANPTFASDAGLADRLLVVRMGRRTGETSDAQLSAEIREHRNAGLSFIAQTLSTALADTQGTPSGLNQRHPDFASFAVRIGRAIGREAETITALRAAETDKSTFCIENDPIGAALLSYLAGAIEFAGTAKELRDRIVEMDGDLADKLSAKRLGKRLLALWPHLEKVLEVAQNKKDRKNFTVFTLRARTAEFAEFQTGF